MVAAASATFGASASSVLAMQDRQDSLSAQQFAHHQFNNQSAMAQHQAYNTMGYNQRSPMTGMAAMSNYGSMGTVNPSMSMNSMNSMSGMNNVGPMNHMMMSGGVSNMSGMTGMSPMNPMSNMGMMNSGMTPAGIPMNKMTMQLNFPDLITLTKLRVTIMEDSICLYVKAPS
ncbi:hypothetical protein QAD02_004590 [Eretmocerus hayati]|uniref:Uncharacterized protein n=1 Tax=Eretmocerus hayati TaxID=131215 RepID=A0ACC2NQ61_9HYME|nr:hypothetical protein QAD02_004590 [Eretmocerus hayati]